MTRAMGMGCVCDLTLCGLHAVQHNPVLPNAALNESNATAGSERKASHGREAARVSQGRPTQCVFVCVLVEPQVHLLPMQPHRRLVPGLATITTLAVGNGVG